MLIASDALAAPHTHGLLGPSSEAALHASTTWKRTAWRFALALADEGHFGWEDLRQALLQEHCRIDATSDWLQCRQWLSALSRVMQSAGLVDAGMLAELGEWADRAAALDQVALDPA